MKKIILINCLLLLIFTQTKSQEIFDAIKSGNLDKTKRLIEKDGSLVNLKDAEGNTPLHKAGIVGSVPIAEHLLSKGADRQKMKKIILGTFCLLVLGAYCQNTEVSKNLLTKQQWAKDLDFAVAKLIEVHPGLYCKISPDSLAIIIRNAKLEIENSSSDVELAAHLFIKLVQSKFDPEILKDRPASLVENCQRIESLLVRENNFTSK